MFKNTAPTFCLFFTVVLALVLQPNCSYSNTAPSIVRDDKIIQQQEEQRRKALQQEHLQQYEKSLPDDDYLLPKSTDKVEDSVCVVIEKIDLAGCTLLDLEELEDVFARYEQKCLRIAEINELIREITNIYIAYGYITTRVFVPQQDMSSGLLKLIVVEGEVSGIEFNPPVEGYSLQLSFAFPAMDGEKLNIRDIEQGLDQLNKLPSNNAKVRLEPGEKIGTTHVVIDNQPERTWRPGAGFDNSGQELTGVTQFLSSFEKDNLLGLNDLLSLNFNCDAENFFNGRAWRSFNVQSFYTVGYGYWTLSGSLGYFDYNTKVGVGTMQMQNSGRTATGSILLERVVYRDSDRKFSLGSSLLNRCTRSFFNDVKLTSSSYQLSTLSLYGLGVVRIFESAISFRGEYIKGLPIFGASPTDSSLSLSSPQSVFEKVAFNVGFMRPFQLFGQQIFWNSKLNAQWSPDTLYSPEQISLGSRYTVRGFHEDSVYGSTGGYIRNDLSVPLAIKGLGEVLEKALGQTELFVGYDAGRVLEDSHDAYEGGTVQGCALGLRMSGGLLAAELTFAKPLDAPAYLQKNDFEIYSTVKLSF